MGYKTVIIILLWITVSFAQTGEDGQTYTQRQTTWEGSDANCLQNLSIWKVGWLEHLTQALLAGCSNTRVDSAIDYMTTTPEYWWKGQRVQWGLAALYLIKFGNSIGDGTLSVSNENKLINAIEDLITQGYYFSQGANPNKKLWGGVGIYLYTQAFDNTMQFSQYGQGSTSSEWPSFTYNGNTYTFGSGPYNANTLCRDLLMHRMESWVVGTLNSVNPDGPREFFSTTYARAYMTSWVILYEGLLLLNADATLRQRSVMAAELAYLDHVTSWADNSVVGWGRANYNQQDSEYKFPFYVYHGMGSNVTRYGVEDVFISDWNMVEVVNEIAWITDEADSYWTMVFGYYDDTVQHDAGKGRWAYRTPYFGIGGSVGSNWEGFVAGVSSTKFIRFWINNDSAEPAGGDETRYKGEECRQYRGSVFADVVGQAYYHQVYGNGETWDDSTTAGGWTFMKEGKSMVAYKVGSNSGAVEMAVEGVYGTWAQFKTNVQANNSLTATYFKNSFGDSIGTGHRVGLNSPGDQDSEFPFVRLRMIDSNGDTLVNYNEATDVLTIKDSGLTRTLDFGNWSTSDPPPSSTATRKKILINVISN